MRYPLEASDIERFTPPSLANLPVPPVFLLRAGSRRDRSRYQQILIEEGLRQHDQRALRDETLAGLKALWSPDDYEAHWPRLKVYWDAIDQYQREHDGADDAPAFAHPDQDAVEELLRAVGDAHPPLRRLVADNVRMQIEAPAIMLSIVLSGWEGLDLAYRREAGVVPLDLIEPLIERLIRAGATAPQPPADALLPWSELCQAAWQRMFLTEEAEKNSSSPPQSSATRRRSKGNGKAGRDGSSKALGPSTEIPAS